MDYGLNFLDKGPVFDGRDHPYPAAAILAAPLSWNLSKRASVEYRPLDIENPENLFPSRALNLAIAAITLIFFAYWVKAKFGIPMGLLALGIGTLDPGWVAQARFFTTDILHACGLVLGALAVGCHARTRAKFPFALAAIGFTLACSAKFSGLLLVPASFLIYTFYAHRLLSNPSWIRAIKMALIPTACLTFLGAGLFLLLFEIHALLGITEFGKGFNHLMKGIEFFGEVRSTPRGTFLLGNYYPDGSLLYFPLLIVAKTPISLIALICATNLKYLVRESKAVFPELALAAGVYLLVAIFSKVNLGYRHLTPILPLLWFLAASGAWRILNARKLRLAAPFLGIFLLVECLMVHPNYLPFTNLAFGGEKGAHRVAVDSATDWGQDLPALARFLRLPPNREATLDLAYFGSADPAKLGIQARWRPCGLLGAPPPKRGQRAACGDPAELLAISATCLQGAAGGNAQDSCYDWLRNRPPDAVLGGSILIYQNIEGNPPPSSP